MREYTVAKKKHSVYDIEDDVPSSLRVLGDWRLAKVGDWVKADDGCTIQVLRVGTMRTHRGKVKERNYVGTCTGTFCNYKTTKMDTELRDSIYSFSGKRYRYGTLESREKPTTREILFAQQVSRGSSPSDAYYNVYDTKSKRHATLSAGVLIKTERIQKLMREDLKPILKKLKIDRELVLGGIRDIATCGEKDSDKLKALIELEEILEIKETTKVQEITGAMFQGFQPAEMEVIQKPKELNGGSDATSRK